MLGHQRRTLWTVLGVLLFCAAGRVRGHCLENGWCRDMDTEAEVRECLKACQMDLSDESPVYPGNGHMQPLSENIRKYVMSHFRWNQFGKSNGNGSDLGQKRVKLLRNSAGGTFSVSSQDQDAWDGNQEFLDRQEAKRSYAMEHFRWGKPVGRKRRPIKVYQNEMEEESSENYPQEFRRDLSWEKEYPELSSPEEKKSGESMMSDEEDQPEASKKDGTSYKMRHFRWNTPPKDKRYGGFMTSERSHMPLVTLFKNAIIKSAYKKGQ